MEYPFKDLLPLDEVLEREGYYKDWTHLDPEVFYSLTQISEYIKTKGYGVDVRLLIAQLAEHFGLKTTQVVDLANLLQQKFDNLEGVTQSFTNNINSLVAQMEADKNAVIANVTVDSEVILARGGKATLGERLDDTTAQLAQIVLNVKDLGAVGDGSDETTILQQAINQVATSNATLRLEKGKTYSINAEIGLDLKDNVTIDFNGAKIKALPNSSGRYRVLRGWNVKNIKLISAWLIGDKDEHTGTTGEWGHGLELKGVENFQSEGTFIAENCWGDGIYIGNGSYQDTGRATENIPCKNIAFNGDIITRNCRRQGMSVISVDGLTFPNFYAENIRGTQPMAGIDFEPNESFEHIKNVRIGKVKVVNAGQIVLFSFTGEKFDISIDRVEAFNCSNSFTAYGFGHTNDDPGSIRVGTWYVNKIVDRAAISLNSWYVDYTPRIVIDNFIIDEWDNGSNGYVPDNFNTYLRISETVADNTTMLKGGGISVGNIICKKVSHSSYPFRNAYMWHNGVNAPVGFVFADIYLGFSQYAYKADTASLGVIESDTVIFADKDFSKLTSNRVDTDLNTIPLTGNDLGVVVYNYDSGRANTSNTPGGRGLFLQFNDAAFGKTQMTVTSGSANPLKLRMVKNDGTPMTSWQTLYAVYGSPTTGQVIKWNSGGGYAEWADL